MELDVQNNKNKYKDKYLRLEVTFNADNPEEVLLYCYILDKCKGVGKAKFIKNILREQINKAQIQ